MVTWTDRDDIRERHGKPRRRFSHPGRRAQALNTSGAGIVHRNMVDLQGQMTSPGYTNNKEDINRLKELRRDWNRNRKSTEAGRMITGDVSPQDAYMGMSRDLRQGNKQAYNKMYPITSGFMDYTSGGGMFGLAAKALKGILGDSSKMGSDILQGVGIGGAVPREEATEKVLKNYANKTFGTPNIHEDEFIDTEDWTERENVVIPPDHPLDEGDFTSLSPFDDSRREAAIMNQYPGKGIMETPFGTPNIHADEPWPYEDTEVIEEKTQDGNLISDELWESIKEFDPGTIGGGGDLHAGEDIKVAPWLTDPSLPMPEELTEGEYLPGEYHDELIESPQPIPFDDSNREAGIATLHGKGPKWGKTGRPLEKEFMDYIQRTGDRITYEEFESAWGRVHALPQGLHFQEPRIGRR